MVNATDLGDLPPILSSCVCQFVKEHTLRNIASRNVAKTGTVIQVNVASGTARAPCLVHVFGVVVCFVCGPLAPKLDLIQFCWALREFSLGFFGLALVS